MADTKPPRAPTQTNATTVARFWSKVDKRTDDECWPWTAGTTYGYGTFHPVKSATVSAHRFSLELHLGRPLAPGAFACHHCDNPPCVNPAHLYEGDSKSNVSDAVSRQRHKRGQMDPSAKLTDQQVIEIRERASRGELNRGLAAEFGISETLVTGITRGYRWSHLPGPRSSKYTTRTNKGEHYVR